MSCFQQSRRPRARWEFKVSCRSSGSSCVVVIASDSQIVMDHSRRHGHSVASKHVGLRRLRFQEAIADETLALEKAHTASESRRCVYHSVAWRQDL